MTNLLNKSGKEIIAENDVNPQIRFYRAHPSHPFRVKQQAELLKAEGWWDVIKDLDSRACAVLQVLLDLDREKFVEAEIPDNGREPLIRALFEVIKEINTQLGQATDGIDAGLYEYNQLWHCIGEYLGSGVVPSTLNVQIGKGKYQEVHPTPTVLLNGAYRYYLEGVEKLMSGIKDQRPTIAKHRAFG